ncbi:hypothetical protein [Alistipes sp.]|uniref:hypothetical protein n=1 Tax=Alistipes sp. TaxID=1872444 RepID=UPI003AEF9492
MKRIRFEIESDGPLLQHDDKAANPFNEYAKRLKVLSTKGVRGEEELMEAARTEWMAALYHSPERGYFLKAACFEGALAEAAGARRRGKVFREAVRVADDPALRFKHEKLAPEGLFLREEYKDFRTVKRRGERILRCRPIFRQWSCRVEVWYDPSRLHGQEVVEAMEYAGRYIGLCDYRPRYGRFAVTGVEHPEE